MVKNLLVFFNSITSYIISFRIYQHYILSLFFYLFFLSLIINSFLVFIY